MEAVPCRAPVTIVTVKRQARLCILSLFPHKRRGGAYFNWAIFFHLWLCLRSVIGVNNTTLYVPVIEFDSR